MKKLFVVVGIGTYSYDEAAVQVFSNKQKASTFLENTASFFANEKGFSATMYLDEYDMVEKVVVYKKSELYVTYLLYATKLDTI